MIELENSILDCKKCSRLCNVNLFSMPHVYYNNISELSLFIIGRNPGLENEIPLMNKQQFMEFYKEKWYDCKIAKYFKKTIGEDIIKKHMFFTNVCKCSSPNNSQLTYDEIKNCVPFLEKQLEIVNPKIILTFSSEAKNLNILKNYNNVFNFYHPSYFVYSKDKNLELKQNNKIQTIISKHYY